MMPAEGNLDPSCSRLHHDGSVLSSTTVHLQREKLQIEEQEEAGGGTADFSVLGQTQQQSFLDERLFWESYEFLSQKKKTNGISTCTFCCPLQ